MFNFDNLAFKDSMRLMNGSLGSLIKLKIISSQAEWGRRLSIQHNGSCCQVWHWRAASPESLLQWHQQEEHLQRHKLTHKMSGIGLTSKTIAITMIYICWLAYVSLLIYVGTSGRCGSTSRSLTPATSSPNLTSLGMQIWRWRKGMSSWSPRLINSTWLRLVRGERCTKSLSDMLRQRTNTWRRLMPQRLPPTSCIRALKTSFG